jgi:hypothetical protein
VKPLLDPTLYSSAAAVASASSCSAHPGCRCDGLGMQVDGKGAEASSPPPMPRRLADQVRWGRRIKGRRPSMYILLYNNKASDPSRRRRRLPPPPARQRAAPHRLPTSSSANPSPLLTADPRRGSPALAPPPPPQRPVTLHHLAALPTYRRTNLAPGF